jgi:hypothetical protein
MSFTRPATLLITLPTGTLLPRIAFVGDTAGNSCRSDKSYLLPATPPPDIDLELWNALARHHCLVETSTPFPDPLRLHRQSAEHIRLYRERLRDWAALAQHSLDSSESLRSGRTRLHRSNL